MGSEERLNIEIDDSVYRLIDELEKLRIKFYGDYSNVPMVGYIVNCLDGVKLLCYCKHVQKRLDYGSIDSLMWHGIPVRFKKAGPPEIEIPSKLVTYYAWQDTQ